MNERTFQLYLLSRMRAKERVSTALARLGATADEMRLAYEAADHLGLEDTRATTQAFTEALGSPTSTALDTSVEPGSALSGSRLLRFTLTVWPDLDFAVRAHPDGYAWGKCFRRPLDRPPPPLLTVHDLAPWRFVEAEVTRAFGPSKSEDAWAGWEDLSYAIPETSGGPTRRYLLRFDMDLLQSIEPDE